MAGDDKSNWSKIGSVLGALVLGVLGGGGGYVGGTSHQSNVDHETIVQIQEQEKKTNAKLDEQSKQLKEDQQRITNLQLSLIKGNKKINPEGTYMWQVVDDAQTWKGDLRVDQSGVVTSLDMEQYLTCPDGRRNVRLLNLLPDAWLKPGNKSSLNVSIPAQFFSYAPGKCDSSQIEEKTLVGSLTPTIAYVGEVSYKTASGGKNGGMVIVKKIDGMQ